MTAFSDYFGSIAVDRHELGAERQRPVRDEPARRALPAVRGLRRGQRVAARAARQPEQEGSGPVRLRHDQRRHPARPLHRARGRRAAPQRRAGQRQGADRRRQRRSDRCGCSRCATNSRPSGRSSEAATPKTSGFELAITLREEHYPFWSRGRLNTVERVDLLAETGAPSLDAYDTGDRQAAAAKKVTLTKDAYGKLLHARLTHSLPAKPVGDLEVYLDTNAIDDIWIAVTWGGK